MLFIEYGQPTHHYKQLILGTRLSIFTNFHSLVETGFHTLEHTVQYNRTLIATISTTPETTPI